MLIGKVLKPIVSTNKHPAYKGLKLLLIKILQPNKLETEDTELVIDLVEAGVGDIVLISREGGAIRKILGNVNAPIRAYTTAIVDDWYLSKEEKSLEKCSKEELWE